MNESAGGIGAFNINLKAFIFQLITFVIVLLVLRRWVFPKLLSTLETRRQVLEESLIKAKQTEEALNNAQMKAKQIILEARHAADRLIADANAQAKDIITKAEAAAEARAQLLLGETKEHLAQEQRKAEEQLKKELTDLVIMTTEKVLQEKIDDKHDRRLLEKALAELGRD